MNNNVYLYKKQLELINILSISQRWKAVPEFGTVTSIENQSFKQNRSSLKIFVGDYKQIFKWQWLFYLPVDHLAPREQTQDYKIYYFANKQNVLLSVMAFLYTHVQEFG